MLREIENHNSYKVGMDEIEGLREAMTNIMAPIQEALKKNIYWSHVTLDDAEYKSRDGFIANSHNCGGLTITEVIPKCEEYSFNFLSFGECESEEGECEEYCVCQDEGHLDASLRIWFKYEGQDSDGEHQFCFLVFGGNGDAPYFRTKYSEDYYEGEFTCNSLDDLRRKSQKHVEAIIRLLNS